MFGPRNVSNLPVIFKSLVPAGLALTLAAGFGAAPANAGSLADYYRTMYTMKFCTTVTEAAAETEATTGTETETPTETTTETSADPEAEVVADPDGTQTEDDQSIRLPVDQEFIDIEATSEDIAPIFEQLNAEYNADPQAFCEANAADAQKTVEQTN
jgi:hypothetical protein